MKPQKLHMHWPNFLCPATRTLLCHYFETRNFRPRHSCLSFVRQFELGSINSHPNGDESYL